MQFNRFGKMKPISQHYLCFALLHFNYNRLIGKQWINPLVIHNHLQF